MRESYRSSDRLRRRSCRDPSTSLTPLSRPRCHSERSDGPSLPNPNGTETAGQRERLRGRCHDPAAPEKRGRGRKFFCPSRDQSGGWLKPGIPGRSRRQEQDRSRVTRKCGGTITKLCHVPENPSGPRPQGFRQLNGCCSMRRCLTGCHGFFALPCGCRPVCFRNSAARVPPLATPQVQIAIPARIRIPCVSRLPAVPVRRCGVRCCISRGGDQPTAHPLPGMCFIADGLISGTRVTLWCSEHPCRNPVSRRRYRSVVPRTSSGNGMALRPDARVARSFPIMTSPVAPSSVRGRPHRRAGRAVSA